MTRRTNLIFALALAVGAGAAQERSQRIDELVGDHLEDGGPGAVVTVAVGGEIVHRKAYGLADLETGRPLTAEHVFDLASVSKQFTATAILLLARRGALSLDDDIRRHLPEIEHGTDRRPIRIVDLLHMTAGLADYMDLFDDFAGATNADVARRVGKARPEFRVGRRYEYSNTAYNLLALIVERASGKRFGTFLAESIFEPAAMKRSVALDRKGLVIEGRPAGYAKDDDGDWAPSRSDTPTLYGDGNVFSTVDDLVLWDRALRTDALDLGDLLARSVTPGRLDSGRATDYGFGWTVDSFRGHRRAWHTGGWYGTSTYIGRYLDRDLVVVVLSNDEDLDAGGLGDEIEGLFIEAGRR